MTPRVACVSGRKQSQPACGRRDGNGLLSGALVSTRVDATWRRRFQRVGTRSVGAPRAPSRDGIGPAIPPGDGAEPRRIPVVSFATRERLIYRARHAGNIERYQQPRFVGIGCLDPKTRAELSI